MATRSITLELKSKVDGFVNGIKTAKQAATDLAKSSKENLTHTGKQFAKFHNERRQDYQQLQSVSTKTGAALLAGTAAVTKAAMDWQSSWAGVTKTNEGTSEQMSQLEGDLRGIAKTLPATHGEIAATAESAGQLGVAVDDVSVFTETMIHMGESTNLSAEEAAVGLARFSNLTGTAWADVGRLGSAIVGLGNNFATTEAEILQMGTRLAATGTQAGLSEGEILGLATAMSSVGIEAEAGGTAIAQTFNNIDRSVREGGEKLQGWAELAGTTASKFAKTWESEPAKAVEMVVQGLGRVQEEGGSVASTLEELGVKGIRQADMMRRLASAGDILGDAFAMGNEEFAKNTALIEEATQRYETAESKVKIAWNQIVDAAIDAGAVMLPIVSSIAESVGGIATAFGNLPGPVKSSLTVMGGVAGVSLLAAGGLMKVFSSAMETRAAWQGLSKTAPGATRAITGLGKAAGVAAAAVTLLSIATSFSGDITDGVGDINHFAQAIRRLGEDSDGARTRIEDLVNSSSGLGGELRDLEHMFDVLDTGGLERAFKSPLGALGLVSDELDAAKLAMGNYDKALESLVSTGNIEAAAEGFKLLLDAAGDRPLDDWIKDMPQLEGVLYDAGISMEEFARAVKSGDVSGIIKKIGDSASDAEGGLDGAAGAMGDLGDEAGDASESLEDLISSLRSLGLLERDARAAARDFEQALDDMSEAIAKNGRTLDTTTQKGRDNEDALDRLAQATLDNAAAAAENGAGQEELQGILARGAGAFQKFAEQLTGSKEKAEELTRKMFEIPDDVSVKSFMSEEAKKLADATKESVEDIPDSKDVEVIVTEDGGVEVTKKQLNSIEDRTVGVAVTDDGTIFEVQGGIDNVEGKTEFLIVDDNGTVRVVQKQINDVTGKTEFVYVNENGTTRTVQGQIDAIKGKGVTITATADTARAESALNSVARTRSALIQATIKTMGQAGVATGGRAPMPKPGAGTSFPVKKHSTGGLAGLPGYSTGGQLPYLGKGIDEILAINRDGIPIAWVDELEWIINRRNSQKYNGVLSRINRDDPSVHHLAGYNNGGQAGRTWAGQTQYALASGAAQKAPTVIHINMTTNNPVAEPAQRTIARAMSLVANPQLGGVNLVGV